LNCRLAAALDRDGDGKERENLSSTNRKAKRPCPQQARTRGEGGFK